MKSLTIYKMDDELYQSILLSAKENHRSINQEIKENLNKFYNDREADKENASFKKFLGVWSQAEYEEFNKNIEDFEKIDEEDWI